MSHETSGCILVVDDDAILRRSVGDYLAHHGYQVLFAGDGDGVSSVLAKHIPHMIILDWGLPGESGLDIARRIRKNSDVPIIMLTGRGDEVDRIIGLEIGADDYIVKPFSPRELVARVRTVLRRRKTLPVVTDAAQGRFARFSGWLFDTEQHLLSDHLGRPGDLTSLEADLLALFIARQNQVLGRDDIAKELRRRGAESQRSIDVLVLRLRRKIEPNPDRPVIIKTVRKAGYVFPGPLKWEGAAVTGPVGV